MTELSTSPSESDSGVAVGSVPEHIRPGAASRKFGGKKRVQFKEDADLVQVRPITPSSPKALHRSRSAPSFAEMAPCDPRKFEQVVERARVSDFILSLGCHPASPLASFDPSYRIRPSSSISSAAHASTAMSSCSPNGSAVPSTLNSRFANWTCEGTASETRPAVCHRSTANTAPLSRFYTTTTNTYHRSSSSPHSSSISSVTRPASANYPRLGIYKRLPVLSSGGAGPQNGNSKRIDVANTSQFITVRRLTSSPSILNHMSTSGASESQPVKKSRAI